MFAWGVLLPVVLFCAAPASAQSLLDPSTLTKYIDPLPQVPVRTPSGKWNRIPLYEVHVEAAKQKLHSQLDPTTVFTFDGAVPGPTFQMEKGQDIIVRYYNDLPQQHLLSVDTTIHVMKDRGWGDRSRFVPHLHGGDVQAQFDGWPMSFINPGQNVMYHYLNGQPAATLWYHDRAAGITRLNTYAGLAGFYIITDRREGRLKMPSGSYELAIAVQDRKFYADGELYYPDDWCCGFAGDVALVNGVIWPKLEVEPRKYRIRLLNACNDRFLSMKLLEADATGNVAADSAGGPAFYMIGTEQGLVNNTVVLNDPTEPQSPRLLVAPGDRRDIIIDFAGQQGKDFLMHNNAPAPFDGTFPPEPENPLPELFLVHVQDISVRDRSQIPMNPGSVDGPNPGQAALTRDIFLHEIDSSGTTVRALINDRYFTDPTTEFPAVNKTEIWRYINTNMHVHPMHMHLVNFQILDRQPFDVDHYLETRELIFTGAPESPEAQEVGRRDMVNCPPGYVTRVLTSPFNRLGRYVYDCYNLGLGENEWMRPFEVVETQPTGGLATGIGPLEASLRVHGPEPFRNRASISYSVPFDQHLQLRIYNSAGQEVRTLVNQGVRAGAHRVAWDATDNAGARVAAGIYFYRMATAVGILTQRATLLR